MNNYPVIKNEGKESEESGNDNKQLISGIISSPVSISNDNCFCKPLCWVKVFQQLFKIHGVDKVTDQTLQAIRLFDLERDNFILSTQL